MSPAEFKRQSWYLLVGFIILIVMLVWVGRA